MGHYDDCYAWDEKYGTMEGYSRNIPPTGKCRICNSPVVPGEICRKCSIRKKKEFEMITFEKFSEENKKRCESPKGFNHKLGEWSTSDWFVAMLGELGEAANVLKKLNRIRDGIPGNKESERELRAKLRKELGDTFVYMDLTAQSLGFSIKDAAVEVFNNKSIDIGYPERIEDIEHE